MDILLKYFPDLSKEQQAQFAQLGTLYTEWNEKVNVVSRKDIDNLYEKHVLHSLGIAKIHRFKPGAKVLDVGTGGGFPGIPLAILFPQTHFHLVDSIGKKIMVVKEVAKALGLENIKAEQVRAEQTKGPYDMVVSRAVSRLSKFYPWVKKKLKKTGPTKGILYLKGGDLTEEIKESRLKGVKVHDLNEHFSEAFYETKKVVFVPTQ